MSSPQLVFVTGGSGYVGSHILIELLRKGYRVRAAARGAKLEEMKVLYAKYGPQIEVVSVADIATELFPDALKGVNAVIHTAAPLPTRNGAEEMMRGAVEGTLNVVRQANAAGVKTIIVTSTIATVRNPSGGITDQDWNPVTKEQAQALTGLAAYGGAKTIAERELWTYADANPHLDITTINPPFIYGPLAETFIIPEPSIGALSSLGIIYALMFSGGTYPYNPHYADVRDVAKAHILALEAPSSSIVGRKRIVFGSPFDLDFETVKKQLNQERPEVSARWSTQGLPDYSRMGLRLQCDLRRIEEVLGMKERDFVSAKDTVIDSVDALLAVEKEWIAKGYEPSLPTIDVVPVPQSRLRVDN